MKSGLKPSGFTIVETMIVLVVTSAILISALSLVSGSQNKTQFNQAINDINQQITTVANNVANGYYNDTIGAHTCTAPNDGFSPPKFNNVGGGLGTNSDCIYLGRVIQFTDGEDYFIYNVVGRRQAGVPAKEATTIKDAKPQLIEPAGAVNADYPSTTEKKKLKNGIKPFFVKFRASANPGEASGVAFVSTLAATSVSGTDLESGAQVIEFGPTLFSPSINLTNPLNNDPTGFGFITKFDNASGGFGDLFDTIRNPDKGVAICFDSGTTDQHGLIIIGGAARRGTTDLKIDSGSCSSVTFP